MITRNTQRGIVALILLTGVSYWISREQRDDRPERVSGFNPKLNYVLRDFELQVYDIDGQPTLSMTAPVLSNNPELEIGTIKNPQLVLNQPNITWNLTADSATITADKEHVELSGKVYVQRMELLTGNRVELNTSEVSIEVTPQTASTTEPVSIFDGYNLTDAVGLELDMMNDTFELKQQVRSTYAVN